MTTIFAERDELQCTIEQLRTEREALQQENKQLKRQQQLLQINRSNLLEIQRIAGIADIVVYEVNAMSSQLHCPDATIAAFGIPDQDSSLEDLFRVIHPEDRERFESSYADAMNDGEPHKIPHRIVLPNGSTRIVNHHIKTFMALNGLPIKTVGLIQDVTKRTQMEVELKEALRRAEEATKAKSAFLANMSHEIRTPLNGVMGLAQLMRMTSLTPTQRDYVNDILASSNTLLNLINDILDLAKIEAGKMDIEHIDFQPDELLANLTVLFRGLAVHKAVELVVEKDPRVPSALVGDPLRVRQILTNLVSNAVKFTDRGHISIAVEVLATSEHMVTLRLSVRDTGIGIPTEKLDALFDSFAQADDSTTRKYGGTGLGLAICQHLVTLMRGQMGANSVVGQGSTFWVKLSFARAQTSRLSETSGESGRSTSVRPEAMAKAISLGANTRVLVAEDNIINQKVVCKMLQHLGIGADVVSNGKDAVAAINGHAYVLVLMDCQMPVLDGYEATRRIRALDNPQRTTPIVAMTASAMAGDRERCLEAGMDAYLAKPLELRQVEAILRRFLLSRREGRG